LKQAADLEGWWRCVSSRGRPPITRVSFKVRTLSVLLVAVMPRHLFALDGSHSVAAIAEVLSTPDGIPDMNESAIPTPYMCFNHHTVPLGEVVNNDGHSMGLISKPLQGRCVTEGNITPCPFPLERLLQWQDSHYRAWKQSNLERMKGHTARRSESRSVAGRQLPPLLCWNTNCSLFA
jgi:hypothetical protein